MAGASVRPQPCGIGQALSAVAWAFPLRHMAWEAAHTAAGDPLDATWLLHVGVITAWGAVAGLLAWRLFRW